MRPSSVAMTSAVGLSPASMFLIHIRSFSAAVLKFTAKPSEHLNSNIRTIRSASVSERFCGLRLTYCLASHPQEIMAILSHPLRPDARFAVARFESCLAYILAQIMSRAKAERRVQNEALIAFRIGLHLRGEKRHGCFNCLCRIARSAHFRHILLRPQRR